MSSMTEQSSAGRAETGGPNRHVHVVLFDAVTNPQEIAEDLILLAA